jgi:NAD(P)-dependent dehydrogenase (short-subunit alcohol dehydrogenase family)
VTAPVAAVTGAASGLGAAIAAVLGATGRRVAGLDLHPSGAVHLALEVDVSDPDAVTGAVGRITVGRGGPLRP